MQSIRGVRISILGGDARSAYAATQLAEYGALVRVSFLPVNSGVPNVTTTEDLEELVASADALVVPLPGINQEGLLATLNGELVAIPERIFAKVPRTCPVICILAKLYLKDVVRRYGLQLVELNQRDDFAILNSIPSAEGAIQMAMSKTLITIHGSRSLVVGFGRTGITLARLLKGMGAMTAVAARNPAAQARALEMGCEVFDFDRLGDAVSRAEIIFNTVPQMVLDRPVLQRVLPGTYILDLASAPGGTDFKAAEQLGITAELAPSLPGMVAPKTAGQILARIVAKVIAESPPASAEDGR
ncbi:dipicolinate synthase subunit DpsA [Desulforudis sp. 1088]|uniref:dipicolinate synthase subunit DpsA n=1 Tax=unclassified Candidatus Desulforudis TaxID=2635950 RepID=UPI003CE55ED1